eukprot:5791734-Pyramimonas_sp.AAC.2
MVGGTSKGMAHPHAMVSIKKSDWERDLDGPSGHQAGHRESAQIDEDQGIGEGRRSARARRLGWRHQIIGPLQGERCGSFGAARHREDAEGGS